MSRPHSRGEGLDSAFGRKKHQRVCECNLKLPHHIPVIFNFYSLYHKFIDCQYFFFKCDQKSSVGTRLFQVHGMVSGWTIVCGSSCCVFLAWLLRLVDMFKKIKTTY